MGRHTVKALREIVSDELRKGLIFEANIIGTKQEHVEGAYHPDTREVTINPSVSVVDTLIHELLHRRFPKWSEYRVVFETRRITRQLSPVDVQRLYRKFKRTAKRKTKPVQL